MLSELDTLLRLGTLLALGTFLLFLLLGTFLSVGSISCHGSFRTLTLSKVRFSFCGTLLHFFGFETEAGYAFVTVLEIRPRKIF